MQIINLNQNPAQINQFAGLSAEKPEDRMAVQFAWEAIGFIVQIGEHENFVASRKMLDDMFADDLPY